MTYTPIFDVQSRSLAVDFMRRHPVATLITTNHNSPVASHLPFLIKESADHLKLYSYLSKTNSQWKHLEFEEALVIFQRTLAQDRDLTVPTSLAEGDYFSLHVYGDCNIIREQNSVNDLLKMILEKFDQNCFQRWQSLSSDAREDLSNGLIVFEFKVSDLKHREMVCHSQILLEICS